MTAAAVLAAGLEFDLECVQPHGASIRGPLSSTWNIRFESCRPVRRVAAFKGQRNFAGLWWLATTQCHVGFESWVERDQLMVLDFDREVVCVSSQPFWLHWCAEGHWRRHVPDFFARRADGSAVVVDVRPDDRIAAEDADAFAATARACERVGWDYRRVGVLDPVFAANVRWLAGYRHRRCLDPDCAERLLAAFGASRPFDDGIATVGDPIRVRPVAFHLLWIGDLLADLHSDLLHGASVVTATRAGVP